MASSDKFTTLKTATTGGRSLSLEAAKFIAPAEHDPKLADTAAKK